MTYAGTLVTTGNAAWSVVENYGLGNETTDSGLVPKTTVTQTRSAASDPEPGFTSRGGPSWTTSLWGGYGTGFAVDGAGFGYSESKAMPAAFGGGAPEAATPPETPTGASVVPKGIASEASNYEARLAGLATPRLVTSGSRPLGAGSANQPTMPKVTTPAVGALGFTKSDSVPETPTTRAFASLVTSGMSAPVGAMAGTGSGGFDYDSFSAWAHTGLSVGGAVPAFGIVPDAIDFVLTAAEIPFGNSTTTDLGFAAAGLAATFGPVVVDGPAAAAKIAARAARNADEALAAGKTIGAAAETVRGHVFWSGGERARQAAEAFARSNAMVTLGMTPAGQRADRLTKGLDWDTQARPIWVRASADFARSTSGEAHVYHRAEGVSLESIWRGTEFPILQQQRNRIIYHVVMPDGSVVTP